MKKKIKLEIVIPIAVAIILVAVFVYLDYRKEEGKSLEIPWSVTEKPVSYSDNPEREKEIDFSVYGCGGPGSINLTTVKEADSVWEIDKKQKTVSLGRYRITPPRYVVLDIPKLWISFISDSLSDRDDKWYGLEKSYVSGMILRVNSHDREIKLGGDEYMFIELVDEPFGDYYPYENMDLEFEFLIDLKCNNLKKGFLKGSVCLDNQDKHLDYINNADIQARIRIFAVGCQEFTKDILVNANFQYED